MQQSSSTSSAPSSASARRSGDRHSGGEGGPRDMKERHLLPPSVAEEVPSKGKNIFSRVNKLFKSPRRHHRKHSDTRSDDGGGFSEPDDVERASEIPMGSARIQPPQGPNRHLSPEPHRRRPHLSDSPGPLAGEVRIDSCESNNAKPSPAFPTSATLATFSGARAETASDSGTPGGASGVAPQRWDETLVDAEATTELLSALREKMAGINEDIQKEMGTGATNLKDFLATLDDGMVSEKLRQNARKTFERGNRSRSKRLLHLQHRLEQLMQVSLEVQKSGVPKNREPEEYAKSLLENRKGGKTSMLESVKQSWGGAVENVKGAAGSLSRSLKKPIRSNSCDNLASHSIKDRTGTSEDGEGGITLPRVSTASRILTSTQAAPSGPLSLSDASETPVVLAVSAAGTAVTASSSGGNGGTGTGANLGAIIGGDTASSSRDRRSLSECSQSNSSLREEVSQLRSTVDEIRQQLDDNNYAVEVNRSDLKRNAEFYRSGLEETNSKMERLEELFNESVNSLKDDVHAMGEQLEYRFNERLRCLRDNMEALRNQQSLFERRFEQQFRGIGSLDTGEAYAPSLLKTRLLDLLIAVFNLLVFLLSAAFQLGLRLANLGHLLRQHPAPALAAALALLLLLGAALARDILWAALMTATQGPGAAKRP